MAIVGLKLVTLALVDPKTQQLLKGENGLSTTGLYPVTSADLGTKTANITNIEGSTTKTEGNNGIMDVIVGPASPQVALEFNNLPFEILQKLLGRAADKKGGYVDKGAKPHVALLIESETLDRSGSVYFGFANGIMQQATQNVGTDTSTAQTRETDKPTFYGLSADIWKGKPFKSFYTLDSTFDKANMLKEVFGGFVGNEIAASTTTTQASASH